MCTSVLEQRCAQKKTELSDSVHLETVLFGFHIGSQRVPGEQNSHRLLSCYQPYVGFCEPMLIHAVALAKNEDERIWRFSKPPG